MAYETYYRINFDNELNQRIEILLQKKNGVFGTVIQDYAAETIKLTKNASGEGKYATLIATELTMQFDMRITDLDYWNDFVTAEGDTWKCIATLDTMYIFHGFVLPDEGAVPFQDKPISATIKATDGIGLLKQYLLKNLDGTDFKGEFSIIRYIAACLKKTNLDIPIRVYDNFYNAAFLTRSDDLKWDMVSQTYLDYRTFQKDAVTFFNCYEVLANICHRSFKLFYQKGEWYLVRIGLYQFNPSPTFYTVYASDLSTQVGFEETGTYASVGKNEIIFAINEDQIKSVKFANKTTKTIYNYNVWPELPKNNKFERGALNLPYSGPGYTSYDIDDWLFGGFTGGADTSALPALNVNTQKAYRRSSFNIYGVETDRNIILEQTPSDNNSVLRSDGIPVIKGDKIIISFDRRLSYSGTGTSQVSMMWIQADNGNRYFIGSQNTSQMSPFYWVTNTATRITKYYSTGENFNEWSSFSIEPPEIPFSGTFYIGILTTGIINSMAFFKNFSIEYKPYVAGGYIQVKGDYWTRAQNFNYPDSSDEEIFLSDNIHKVFKGCLLGSNGIPLNPDWSRFGLTENRHYKELINIAEFNHYYRRFWEIEGSFTGTIYSPLNDQTNFAPISIHKTYKLSDITPEERYFMLLTPLEQDLITGNFKSTFAEVNMVPAGSIPVAESLSDFMIRVVTAINSTPDDVTGWNSAGGAPAAGTIAYPPIASIYPYTPNTISVAINELGNMTASVVNGGAGNAPSITVVYNNDVGTWRLIQFTFGTDIAINNIFTFSAYGHNVPVAVQADTALLSADGNQLGDSSLFNYMF